MSKRRSMIRKIVQIRYRPRDQFRAFHSRKQRWSALVCHRRAGKTVATLNDLIRGAVNECKPKVATHSSSRSAIRPRIRLALFATLCGAIAGEAAE